jgi:transcriptional antiterminator RfaH
VTSTRKLGTQCLRGDYTEVDFTVDDSSLSGVWYVVRCKPRHERIVATHLERVGIVTFCPEIKDEQIKPCIHRISSINPLFPGYLFAKFEWKMDFRTVTYCRGVRGVVTFGATPARVEQGQIDAIRARISGGYVALIPTAFTRGQIVSVQDGPLRGIEAVFERPMPGHQRAILLLRALSYQASLVVKLRDIVNP